MSDQAEEIRKRLESLGSGNPLPPPTPSQPKPAPPAPSQPIHQPSTAELARKRRMEAAIEDTSRAQPVIVVDVKIKFWSLVALMVKSAFAAIPAMIIVSIVLYLVFSFLSVPISRHLPTSGIEKEQREQVTKEQQIPKAQ